MKKQLEELKSEFYRELKDGKCLKAEPLTLLRAAALVAEVGPGGTAHFPYSIPVVYLITLDFTISTLIYAFQSSLYKSVSFVCGVCERVCGGES